MSVPLISPLHFFAPSQPPFPFVYLSPPSASTVLLPPMGRISLLTLPPLSPSPSLDTVGQKMKEPTQKNMSYIMSLHLVDFEDKILFSRTGTMENLVWKSTSFRAISELQYAIPTAKCLIQFSLLAIPFFYPIFFVSAKTDKKQTGRCHSLPLPLANQWG